MRWLYEFSSFNMHNTLVIEVSGGAYACSPCTKLSAVQAVRWLHVR